MKTSTLLQNGHGRREGQSAGGDEAVVKEILQQAGIAVNGEMPWDIRVKDRRFFHRVLREGSLGLGESYMDGWWDCEELDAFITKLLPTNPEEKIKANWRLRLHAFGEIIFNNARKTRAFEIGQRHYNKGNELFTNMLDKRMVYSCAYWKAAKDLDSAQEAKLNLICRKLGLRPGDRVLDIGCGWGSFAKYAAEKYGAEVVGITVSQEQLSLGKELCQGLPVELRLQDYRDMNGLFDHIVSVGMFEHVGWKNYRIYMEKARQCLKDDGLFLLHCIGSGISNVAGDPWLEKYIFPNSIIPSMKQINDASEGLFIVEDVQNLGFHYDQTLTTWFENFHNNWHKIKDRYDEKFYRMWKYYLLSSAGAFRCRNLQVWQFVLSSNGVKGGYEAIC